MANEQTKEETYAYYYHTNYIRNARAIAIAWAIFTLCFFIIVLVVFVQPYWLGDGPNANGIGNFGLYRYCTSYSTTGAEPTTCEGGVFDFSGVRGADGLVVSSMVAATVFVGLAVIFVALSIISMLLFLCKGPFKTGTVFAICGVFQLLSGICLLLGILIYPSGWSQHSAYKALCQDSISYTDTKGCELRWVFFLAIIAVFDAFILAILAFILASKQGKLYMDMHFSDYYKNGKSNGVQPKPKKHGTVNSTIFNTYPAVRENNRPRINGSASRDNTDGTNSIPRVEDDLYAQR
ncbi:LHFPL tetraspan subfamily member 3 protein-like isoform X2 [Lytechinus pictus]|uniref:LHFPL tetraspan subfamily member 3 protein-like isoform X2 n=1 Tax=Lytechinus variegatus TaxID=7654 RepID=UPI001BB22290|nr:LHFPL tetraspan subfamily member 3 protein-like isoform X2 [Lytechinus variegatus]XP_054752035.1 LHFPL tetraspan subfamily member 3 protein-like isoform X2 [Lytechinus pictus]XP_054752036.1 LHFPL tetraspan subfamily member 3 protein-like isoform X2 [Lytechinus pictus]